MESKQLLLNKNKAMRLLIILLINIILFFLLRLLSVLGAFWFLGIGASAPSEKWLPYITIPGVVFQIVLLYIFFNKKKCITDIRYFLLSLGLIFTLFFLDFFNALPL